MTWKVCADYTSICLHGEEICASSLRGLLVLEREIKDQLAGHLTNLRYPVEIVATLGDDVVSRNMFYLLNEIDEISEKVIMKFDGSDCRTPSFSINSRTGASVRFAGLPLGHEFTSLVLALLWAGGHPPRVSEAALHTVRTLEAEFAFELYFSPSCQICAHMVQSLALLALHSPSVSATFIEASAFRAEVENREVSGFPVTFLNGKRFINGAVQLENLLSMLTGGPLAGQAAAPLPPDRSNFATFRLASGGLEGAIYCIRAAGQVLHPAMARLIEETVPAGVRLALIDETKRGGGEANGHDVLWRTWTKSLEAIGFVLSDGGEAQQLSSRPTAQSGFETALLAKCDHPILWFRKVH